jgi:hypothetical protein
MPRRLLVTVLALLAAACGGSDDRSAGRGELQQNVWTWVDIPGAVCSDGSGTGIAVNPGDPDLVVLFLDGGGACWDALTCFTFDLADPGPFGPKQFEGEAGKIEGSFIDRTVAENPFRDATLVYVPYCTGDVHAGDAVQDYPGAPRRWYHKGRPNLLAAVAWIERELTPPSKVVVSGASAGGYGALLMFDLVKQAWPDAKGYLVDDSGPPLEGDDFSPVLRATWFLSWRLDETVLPLCGAECATDLSELLPALSRKYPGDRIALLSSRHDEVMRSYFLLGSGGFESALLRVVDDVIAPLPNVEAFLVPGSSHTMLGDPAAYTAGDTNLVEWLGRMVGDDPSWDTAGR